MRSFALVSAMSLSPPEPSMRSVSEIESYFALIRYVGALSYVPDVTAATPPFGEEDFLLSYRVAGRPPDPPPRRPENRWVETRPP